MARQDKISVFITFFVLLGLVGAGFFYATKLVKQTDESTAIEAHPRRASSITSEKEVKADGTHIASFYAYPKYYEDEAGELREIDPNIQKSEQAGFDWEVGKGIWRFYAKNDGTVVSKHLNSELQTKLHALAYFDNQTKKYSIIKEVNVVRPVVAENQIIWPAVLPGIDYKLTYIHDTLKEEVVMEDEARNNLPSPEDFNMKPETAYLVFLFETDVSGLRDLKTEIIESGTRHWPNLGQENFTTLGRINFINDQGAAIISIDPGFVKPEQKEDRTSLLKGFLSEGINNWFISGVGYSQIKNLEPGTLIFDPTLSFRKGDGKTYSQVEDTTTDDGESGENDGWGTNITAQSDVNTQRALFKLPNLIGASPGQIPENANVVRAVLTLYCVSEGNPGPTYLYKMLDQWTSGNLIATSVDESGEYGASYDSAQDKYNTETAYINDGDGITASETSVTVDDGSGGAITIADWPTEGLIMIDSEIIWYGSRTSTSFDDLVRGVSSTTPASHSNNATVDGDITWVESGGSAGPSGNSVDSTLVDSQITNTNATFYSFDITSAVQDWASDKDNNYGLDIMVLSNWITFASAENDVVGRRPSLTVSYNVLGQDPIISGAGGGAEIYESKDTAVSPSSPGTPVGSSSLAFALEAADSGYFTTATSTTEWGYDSQVFKFDITATASPEVLRINWTGHGESATTGPYNISVNIWNFNTSAWEELATSSARYNSTFASSTGAIASFWGTNSINALLYNPDNGMIYIAGGSIGLDDYLAEYNPSTATATDLRSLILGGVDDIESLALDSFNNMIYIGCSDGVFLRYNPSTGTMTDLDSLIASWWGSDDLNALAYDSANREIYLGGDFANFAKYNPDTNQATNLSSRIGWFTNIIEALVYDPNNNEIYLAGGSLGSFEFGKYSLATASSTDLGSKISSFWGSGDSIHAMAYDSDNNMIYLGGTDAQFANYNTVTEQAGDLSGYLPPVWQGDSLRTHSITYGSTNKVIYLMGSKVGNDSPAVRFFPETLTSEVLTNDVYSAWGSHRNTASTFDTASSVLYIGNDNGDFGSFTTPSDTTLSGVVLERTYDYYDVNGYVWIWVKADNEYSAPVISNIASTSNDTSATITWDTDEGADGALAWRNTSGGVYWDDYSLYYYEDEGWLTSHSIAKSSLSACNDYFYRVRSCDRWGTCTVSAEYELNTTGCGGSCPYVYGWDGDKFRFEVDIYGSGGLAYKMWGMEDFVQPAPRRTYALKYTEPKKGNLEFRIYNDLSEINYFDHYKLYSYFVPQDREVIIESPTLGSGPKAKSVIHTVSTDPLLPISAVRTDTGESVLDLISKRDDDKRLILNDNQEEFTYKSIEVDFGDVSRYPTKKIIIKGSTTYPNSQAGIKRKQQFKLPWYLYVLDEAGAWQQVPKNAFSPIKPLPFDSILAVDISNIFISDQTKIKLEFLYKTYLDYIAFDHTEDLELEKAEEFEIKSADLRSTEVYHKFNKDGNMPDYYDTKSLASISYRHFPGSYTKFGEVKELLKIQDDKFVIMAKGDEITIKHKAPKENTVPSGLKRTVMLDVVGFYKAEGKTEVDMTVDPLPFANMSNFPYDEDEYPHDNDSDYQEYLRKWNTRHLGEGKTNRDYLPWIEKLEYKINETIIQIKGYIDDILGKVDPQDGFTMNREGTHDSANTDYLEVYAEEKGATIKGGTRIRGGVRAGHQ